MEDEVVETPADDGTSPEGTSILDREAKLRNDPEPTVQIVEKTAPATTEDDPDDDDDDEPDNPAAPVLAQTPTIPDPGEFKPGDYTFEVTVLDAEGKNARVHKIKSVEQWDDLLETDPNLGSASALLRAQRAASKMENSLERDQRDFEAKKAAFDSEKSQIEAQAAATNVMVAEIGYLQAQGKLPAVDKKYVDADWSDPEVAKQPGVKEQLALLNYMRKENGRLSAAGLPRMTSIRDAFNSYRIDQAEKKAPARKQAAGVARKQAGARVSGVSPAPSGAAPAGISVGRGGSLRDLGRQGF